MIDVGAGLLLLRNHVKRKNNVISQRSSHLSPSAAVLQKYVVLKILIMSFKMSAFAHCCLQSYEKYEAVPF